MGFQQLVRGACQTSSMDFDVLFSGVPVSDFTAAQLWYERFFGRPPDIVAHEAEVMWRVSDGGWLYVLRDVARAGKGIVTMAVSDIEAAVSSLQGRGLEVGPIKPEGDSGRKAVVLDPDANTIAIIQVSARA
jgi:predicted enzyme related to lactoylglutathione lyase